jgi:hypothetical protein
MPKYTYVSGKKNSMRHRVSLTLLYFTFYIIYFTFHTIRIIFYAEYLTFHILYHTALRPRAFKLSHFCPLHTSRAFLQRPLVKILCAINPGIEHLVPKKSTTPDLN